MRSSLRSAALALVAVAVVAVVAACGSLPVSDRVHRVRAVAANAPQDTNVRLIPPAPQPGDGPKDIVTGFLRAAASDAERARQFLADGAKWQADAPVRVYSDVALLPRVVATTSAAAGRAATSNVDVTMTPVATLEPSGAVVPTAGTSITMRFTLADVPGTGWRLTSAPNGVALSVSDLASRAEVPLTFFAPTGDAIVRRPVLLDPGDDLGTTAVDALLAAAPTGMRTYVPAGTALNDVSVGAATVVVDLTQTVAKVSGEDLRRLGVQLAATLLPLEPGATALRIDVGGRPLEGSGLYTVTDVERYEPDLSTPATTPVVVDAGAAHAATVPAAGPASSGPATPVAVSDDGRTVAWVRARRVVTASVASPGRVTAVTGSGSWRSLSWGRDGSLWVVRDDAQDAAAPNVSVVRPAARRADPVTVPAGLDGTITQLHVARDGVSAIVVADGVLSEVSVGEDAGGPVLRDVVPVAPGLHDVAVATAPGRDGVVLAYAAYHGRTGLWRVETVISTQLLDGSPGVTRERAPCAGAVTPTALSVPGGDGRAPTLAVCDGELRTRVGDGTWSDAGPADGAAWPGG